MLQKTTNLAVFVSIVALALGSVVPIGAQVAGATLSGTITDQQGGALGGAKVVVKNVATDVAVQTGTNTDGAYTVPNLRPADYEVTASAAGDTFQLDYVTEPWYDLSLNKGLSDFNVGRNLVINGMWTPSTPKTKGARAWALGGWQFGVITAISDGIPFYPNLGSDGSDMLGEINPSVNPPQFIMGPGCSSYGSAIHVGNPNQYVNPNCFGLVPLTAANAVYCDTARSLPGTCFNIRGNVGRNTLIGPGLLNTDFSIFKNNYIRKITETFNIQFRAELFNVLNRTNFGPPNANSLEVINFGGTVH